MACDKNDAESPDCQTFFLKDRTEVVLGIGDGVSLLSPRNEPYFVPNFDRVSATTFFLSFLWPELNTYAFEASDRFVDYLLGNGLEVHAHVLLYALPSVSPDFLVSFNGSNEAFEQQVKDFIQATLTRFRGRVKAYDLTNELFDYNSSQTNPTWLRNRFTTDEEFFDFIGRCFEYAHEADPDALLFYNDYGQEFTNGDFEKGRAIFQQIMQWKNRGVPIHGYGIQLHTNIYRPIEDIRAAFELAVKTGLLIHISELDVSLNWADFDLPNINGGEQGITSITDDLLDRQANMYRLIAQTYRETVPRAQQYGITLWGVSDEDSWLGDDRFEAGTLMADPTTRKPAFIKFLEGLSDSEIDCK